MENPQNTPSEQDMRNTNDNPSIGRAGGIDEATGMPLEGETRYTGGTTGMDTENPYEAPEVHGGTGPGPTPSQTGVVGSGSGSQEESESGLEGTSTGTSEPSSTGVVGAGETAEGETTSAPER